MNLKKDKRKDKEQEEINNDVCLSKEEHQKIIDELAEYKDKYIRLFAEFDNARKRMERERGEFVRYANQELIVEFLNILDDLERSIEAARANHEDYDAFLKGIEMVMAHVYDLLKKNDVKPIEAKGKMFDPNCHEVLMQEEDDKVEEGTVLEEFQKGYMIGDRIVRTNKVKVAKKKE
ncbi:MAG: nucleotide exchange factor GrpE [Candidatus Aceula meridiana]|nr:nucleotide exchange factor GrpE [Candidatus Aceula meridiana]